MVSMCCKKEKISATMIEKFEVVEEELGKHPTGFIGRMRRRRSEVSPKKQTLKKKKSFILFLIY